MIGTKLENWLELTVFRLFKFVPLSMVTISVVRHWIWLSYAYQCSKNSPAMLQLPALLAEKGINEKHTETII